jgi:hypothetical protein
MDETYQMELIPLTTKEAERRAELEQRIFETVRQSYITLGELLTEIGEKRLYKSTHHVFEDYCRDVLDMAKRTAYQYIQAFGVVRNLSSFMAELPEEKKSPIGYFLPEDKKSAIADFSDSEKVRHGAQTSPQQLLPLLPQNERQARALVNLTPEEQRQVWLQALETAPAGKVTAAHVRATVRTLKGEKMREPVQRAQREKSKNGARISAEFHEAFKGFLAAVQAEIDSNWATTDRLTVVRHLDGIRGAISENGNHTIPAPGYRLEASNTEKLLAAGYTIYRMLPAKLIIERLIGNDKWEVVGPIYPNTESMTVAFEQLMLDQQNLRA